MQNNTLIFFHIPKTGGITLQSLIKKQYKKPEIFITDGAHVKESILEFKKLSEEKRSKLKVIMGHMPFGLHTYIPHNSNYITILREPVNRILSEYCFIRESSEKVLQSFRNKAINMGLREFVNKKVCGDNFQTRLLSGNANFNRIETADCPIELLDIAKENIKNHFEVVGILERFEETLALLKIRFNWDISNYSKHNRTLSRIQKKDLTKDELKTMKKRNRLDIKLYEFAKKRFNKQIKQQNVDFERELKIIQNDNKK